MLKNNRLIMEEKDMKLIKENQIMVTNWRWEGRNAYFDILIKGEEFQNIEAKYEHNCSSCKIGKKCSEHKVLCELNEISWNCKTMRKLDCLKEQNKLFNVIIAGFIFIISLCSLMTWHNFSFEYAMIVITIGAAFLCGIVYFEKNYVESFRNEIFYFKLKKEKSVRKQENEKVLEEQRMENLKINPYLEEMEKARQSISYFILISGRYNLENDNESIKRCIKGLKEIMNTLEKNCLSYPRVSTLFKVNLPEMSSLLLQYTSLVEANCVKESDTNLLNETFINFLNYLETLKKEIILNKSEENARMSFEASADVMNELFNK